MSTVKIKTLISLLFLLIEPSFLEHSYASSAYGSSEEGSLIPTWILDPNSLDFKLNAFTHEHTEFNEGINTISRLYVNFPDFEMLYGSKQSYNIPRKIIFGLELIAGGACGVVKCLSIYHPNINEFGKALIGCYTGKAVLWGIDACLNNAARQSSIALIKSAQTDSSLVIHLSQIANQVNNMNITPVLNIAKQIISKAEKKHYSGDNLMKLERLKNLTSTMSKASSFKKIAVTGGKVLSFLIGTAAGISIAAAGQTAPCSYWLTLIADGFDPVVDCANTIATKKPIIQRYITISEILYLCEDFIQKFNSDYSV